MPPASFSESPTDRIEHIAQTAARAAIRSTSGEHVLPHQCHQEGEMADHRKRLAEGDLRFERIDGTLKHMDEKLSTIVGVLKWVGGAIGLGLLSTGGAAFLWVIVHMGKGA